MNDLIDCKSITTTSQIQDEFVFYIIKIQRYTRHSYLKDGKRKTKVVRTNNFSFFRTNWLSPKIKFYMDRVKFVLMHDVLKESYLSMDRIEEFSNYFVNSCRSDLIPKRLQPRFVNITDKAFNYKKGYSKITYFPFNVYEFRFRAGLISYIERKGIEELPVYNERHFFFRPSQVLEFLKEMTKNEGMPFDDYVEEMMYKALEQTGAFDEVDNNVDRE